jgi:hypothetical protein
VFRIKKLKKRQGPMGSRAIEREREEYRLLSSSLCSFLQPRMASSLFDSNIPMASTVRITFLSPEVHTTAYLPSSPSSRQLGK